MKTEKRPHWQITVHQLDPATARVWFTEALSFFFTWRNTSPHIGAAEVHRCSIFGKVHINVQCLSWHIGHSIDLTQYYKSDMKQDT